MKKQKKVLISKTPIETANMLGLEPSITLEWELRLQISEKIVQVYKSKKISVTELAKKAETSRSRITNIVKGNTSGISMDVLLRVLSCLGQKAKFNFSQAA